jgi:hypothetical protein
VKPSAPGRFVIASAASISGSGSVLVEEGISKYETEGYSLYESIQFLVRLVIDRPEPAGLATNVQSRVFRNWNRFVASSFSWLDQGYLATLVVKS